METKKVQENKTLSMVYIALFAVVMAICSWISIPATIPFTLQTMGVFLAVGLLGGKRGTIAVLLYLLLGLVGLPVFAGFSGGVGVLMGATGGYIIGFLFSALFMWGIEKLFGKKTITLAISMVIGLIVCYLFGTVWFMTVYTKTTEAISFVKALSICVIPYLIPDAIKIALALFLTNRLSKIIKLK